MNRSLSVALAFAIVTSSLAMALVGLPGIALAQDPEPLGKVLYFQDTTNANGDAIMNTSRPADDVSQELVFTATPFTFSFFLDPLLAGDLRMNGTFTVLLWVRQVSAPGETNFIDFSFDIYEVNETGARIGLLVSSPATSHLDITTHYSEYIFSAEISTIVTGTAGNGLEIEITMESNTSNTKHVSWGSAEFPSRLVVGAVDRIDVSAIALLNDTGVQPAYFEQTDNVTINATVTDPFGGYDIVWANVTIVAPDGSLALDREPMALTSGNDTSFAKTFELVWSDTNKLRGIYNLTVSAVDRTGYHFRFPDRPGDETYGGHLETETVQFAVGEIIYANFLVNDGEGVALGEAGLVIRQNAFVTASLVTDDQGRANATLPGSGSYTAEVWWQDVLVLSQPLSITGNVPESDPIILVAGVYNPTFQLVDVAFVPLGDATVFVTHPNGTTLFRPLTTDANGEVSLTRTAQGTYALRVLWRGIEVGQEDVAVSASTTYVVPTDVFYLTLTARDADGDVVPGVHVIVSDPLRGFVVDSRSTDANGQTISRLPIGTYELSGTWFGVPVASVADVALSANLSMDLDLSIYTVTLTAVDERGVGLEGATVSVEIAAFEVSGFADAQGRATFKLPAGDLSMRVWWRDVLVYDATEAVSASRTSVTLSAAVHYVSFRTVDRDGSALQGVAVTLIRDGVAVDGGLTDGNGTVEFRQPAGSYTVVARLQTTYLLTNIDLTIEQGVTFPAPGTVELRFEAFAPPFTSTVLFPVLLGLLALLAVALLLWWKLLRGKKKGAPEIPAAEPPKPEG